MKTKKFKLKMFFKASSYDIYESFMDAKKLSAITGKPAVVSRAVTGNFNLEDGEITGTNVDLIQDRKILQHWRMKNWSEGHHALLEIQLVEKDNGTIFLLKQTDIPRDAFDAVSQRWSLHLENLKKIFES